MSIFEGSIPYGPDLRRIEEAFPVPSLSEGRQISHAELEAVTHAKRGSGRYYGVVNAWINRIKNQNGIVMVWQPGDGLKVLDPGEVLAFSESKTRQKMRQTARAFRNFAWVDRSRLDEVGQRRLDHMMQATSKLKAALDSTRKEIAVELAPVVSLPKRKVS